MLHLFLGCEFDTFFSTQKAHKVGLKRSSLLTYNLAPLSGPSILEPTSVYYSLEGRLYYLGGGVPLPKLVPFIVFLPTHNALRKIS
jgi:hypothetical protein